MDDDAPIVELEQAIADAATLLLRMDKYRRGAVPDVDRLRRAVADVGARARRHHRGAAGAGAMAALRDEARHLVETLEGIVARVLSAPPYRAAVAAHVRGDLTALQPLLCSIFADLTPGEARGDLFVPVDWSGRRGPRPLEELLSSLHHVRQAGLVASGDPLDLGVDPELPAVTLIPAWPDGAPIALVCPAERLATPTLLGPAGEALVHRPVLQAPLDVGFCLDRAAVDDWVEDPRAYHDALAPLLERRGWAVRRFPTPAAP